MQKIVPVFFRNIPVYKNLLNSDHGLNYIVALKIMEAKSD